MIDLLSISQNEFEWTQNPHGIICLAPNQLRLSWIIDFAVIVANVRERSAT